MPVLCICQNPQCQKTFTISPSRSLYRNIRFCSRLCRMTVTNSPAFFWSHVDICLHGFQCRTCCWPWLRSLTTVGYGQITVRINNRNVTLHTHRRAWELAHNRTFPEDLWALHTCDFRACSNPWHIYPGTPRNNGHDASRRQRFPNRQGQNSYVAKVTEEQVLAIRQRYADGETQQQLAEFFHLHSSHISRIVTGEKWSHVPMPAALLPAARR